MASCLNLSNVITLKKRCKITHNFPNDQIFSMWWLCYCCEKVCIRGNYRLCKMVVELYRLKFVFDARCRLTHKDQAEILFKGIAWSYE